MRELLIDCADKLGIDVTQDQCEKFMLYMDLLLEWNEKMNLTAITDKQEIVLKHFIDSISILNLLDKESCNLIDVGTGAGFPGLPLKIMRNDLNVTLMDSHNKRISFLNEIVSRLELQNIKCVHERAEEAAGKNIYRENFEVGVSRAVAKFSVLLEYNMPFIKVDGKFYAYKGPQALDEIKQSGDAVKKLGGEICDLVEVKIPYSSITHTIIIVSKLKQTPTKYPRNGGKISKFNLN